MNKIFKKDYALWWFILAFLIGLKYILFGINENSLWKTETYAESGIIFIIFGTLFNGAVFGMPVYGLYGLISKKWDEKNYMIIISIISLLSLIIL
jgi:hypothetical protein